MDLFKKPNLIDLLKKQVTIIYYNAICYYYYWLDRIQIYKL